MRQSRIGFAVVLAASTTALVSMTTLAADAVPFYGRAGGAVGADRIRQLTARDAMPSTQVPGRSAQMPWLSKWYGRAGGTVGADRIDELVAERSAPDKTYAANAAKEHVVYGRAGVPLPFTN